MNDISVERINIDGDPEAREELIVDQGERGEALIVEIHRASGREVTT